MGHAAASNLPGPLKFGASLAIEQLIGLTAELQKLRCHPPLVKRQDGKYEGDILGFVKGLRLSARVIYFLRERLSQTGLEVNWGHILDNNEQSCSPECDIIIHTKGHVREWNGGRSPVMHFKFIKASCVRAVVSCKSYLTDIDRDYPRGLKKFGVGNVFLFAECCDESCITRLQKKAEKLGYKGLCCLYLTGEDASQYKTDEAMYADFSNAILKTVTI
jgi:hypothetical protein